MIIGGILFGGYADYDDGLALRPVLSLKTDTKILDGLGSINDPYILSDN